MDDGGRRRIGCGARRSFPRKRSSTPTSPACERSKTSRRARLEPRSNSSGARRCYRLAMLTALALFLALHPTPSLDPSWNQFRGAGGRGIAADDEPLPSRLDPKEDARWRCELPTGLSSPCLAGERIFLTAGNESSVETICVDRETGAVRWRRAFEAKPEERVHEINGPASPSPATDGALVVSYFGGVGLVAHDLDGKELWRRAMPPPVNTFGSAASPICAEGKVVFLHDSDKESWLEAIEPATGATLWKVSREGFGSGWSTPTHWERGGTDELLVYGIGWLTAYDLASGEERWSLPGLSDEPIVTPVVSSDLVFVSSYNMRTNPEVIGLPAFAELLEKHDADENGSLNKLESDQNASILSRHDADTEGDHPLSMFFRFLDVDRDGEITELEWGKVVRWVETFQHANGLLAIRPGGGEVEPAIAWQHVRGVPECPSPIFYRDKVYMVTNGGLVTCLAADSGELHYEDRLDSRGPCYSSPVAGDGKLYAASARGRVVVFSAGEELEVLSRNDFDERIMATPALERGMVFVRTEKALYAFGPG